MEDSASMSYVYYKGKDSLADGMVNVLKRMQFEPDYVQNLVAKQIAQTLKGQGVFVWRNGQAVIVGTNNVDRSSSVDIHVEGVFETFTLQAYDAAALVPPAMDH